MPDHAAAASRAGGGVGPDLRPRQRRAPAVPVRDVLPGVLTRLGLAEDLQRWRAVVEWPEIAGERLAAHTSARSVDRGTLWIEAESSAWMHELTFLKRELLARVERHLRAPSIRDIRFSVRER